jgi:hypothetical protein
MDRSPAAGSWLPDNTCKWTDVRDYPKTPVIGQITGCGFAVTGHHQYLDRSMDSPRLSPPDFGLPTGWAARKKNPCIVKENRNCWKRRISNFLKIKCIAFARISIHFFLPHMNF